MKFAIAVILLTAPAIAPDRPEFEVASVHVNKDSGTGPRNSHSTYGPAGVNIGDRTLGFLVSEAYGVPVAQVVPAPAKKDALLKEIRRGYDIVAKADRPASKDQLRLMLRSLLEDRFRLAMHRESRTGPVYKLIVAKGGPKLEPSEGELIMKGSATDYAFRNAEIFHLAGFLSSYVDRLVVDETGLKGTYNFTVKRPEELSQSKDPRSPDSPSSAMFADVLRPLGLQLIGGTSAVEYLVIDHAEPPSEN
jgi:uncharacterized protein (TIGR03435 family)